MDKDERFVLSERADARLNTTVRIACLCGMVVLCTFFLTMSSCQQRSRAHEEETDQERLRQFGECTKTKSTKECADALYPGRPIPLTFEQTKQLEQDRAETAHKIYVHCTDKTDVRDKDCDDKVQAIMREVEAR